MSPTVHHTVLAFVSALLEAVVGVKAGASGFWYNLPCRSARGGDDVTDVCCSSCTGSLFLC